MIRKTVARRAAKDISFRILTYWAVPNNKVKAALRVRLGRLRAEAIKPFQSYLSKSRLEICKLYDNERAVEVSLEYYAAQNSDPP